MAAAALAMTSSILPLSPREHQVCALVVLGQSNQEIATKLTLTPGTVKEHLRRSCAKLGCRNRTELAVRYVQGASAQPTRANHATKRPPRGRGGK